MLKPLLKTPSQNLLSLLNPQHSLSFSSQATHNNHNNHFSNLVTKVGDILCHLQGQKNPELTRLTPKLKPHIVSQIIKTHKSTYAVLSFFYWVSKRPFYKHDMGCFVSMLNRLVTDLIFAPADHLRILMIKACRNEGEVKWEIEYLNQISGKNGFGFTLCTFNTLLLQSGKFEMLYLAQIVYTQMLNSGVKPSLFTFNTMINMLCRKGNIREAELIFSKIFQYDMCPDVFTYTSLNLRSREKREKKKEERREKKKKKKQKKGGGWGGVGFWELEQKGNNNNKQLKLGGYNG